ncbi:PREDICTED: MAGUK p55 subfamily member 2 [Ficedula albicollis]|uniref:MAGUK p55 subfamily member 2 n=1 Tax=Ficedula albicollis TaxID=59894 RepID=UPI000359D80F|nr:PREDICTED: MAGUK p55 subfamily member 2 [Ficedula albicollis]
MVARFRGALGGFGVLESVGALQGGGDIGRLWGTGGIGVTFRVERGELVIARILHGGMVAQQGLLHVGDVIREVNGREVGSDPRALQDSLRHASGSVVLKILPSYQEPHPPRQVPPWIPRGIPNLHPNPGSQPASQTCIPILDPNPASQSWIPTCIPNLHPNPGSQPCIPILDPNLHPKPASQSWIPTLHPNPGSQTCIPILDPNPGGLRGAGRSPRVALCPQACHVEGGSAGLVPSQLLEEKRKAFVKRDGEVAPTSGALCGSLSGRRKKRMMYLTTKNAEFDRHELLIYEEVARMPPFRRKTLVLIGAQGVGRRSLKNKLIMSDQARYGTTIPCERPCPRGQGHPCPLSVPRGLCRAPPSPSPTPLSPPLECPKPGEGQKLPVGSHGGHSPQNS